MQALFIGREFDGQWRLVDAAPSGYRLTNFIKRWHFRDGPVKSAEIVAMVDEAISPEEAMERIKPHLMWH